MAPTQLAAASFVGALKKLYIYKMRHPQNPSDCVGAIKFPGIILWLSKKLYIYKMRHPQNPSDCVGAIKFPGIILWLV